MKNKRIFCRILAICLIMITIVGCSFTVKKGFKQAKFLDAMKLRKIAILPFDGGKEGVLFSTDLTDKLIDNGYITIVSKKQAKGIIQGKIVDTSTVTTEKSRHQKTECTRKEGFLGIRLFTDCEEGTEKIHTIVCTETISHFKVTYSLIDVKTGKSLYTHPITGSNKREQCTDDLVYDSSEDEKSVLLERARSNAIGQIINELIPHEEKKTHIFKMDNWHKWSHDTLD